MKGVGGAVVPVAARGAGRAHAALVQGQAGSRGAGLPTQAPGRPPARAPASGHPGPTGLRFKGRVVHPCLPGSRGPPASRDREGRGAWQPPSLTPPGGGTLPHQPAGSAWARRLRPWCVWGPLLFRFMAMLTGFGDRGDCTTRGGGIQAFILWLTPAPASGQRAQSKGRLCEGTGG